MISLQELKNDYHNKLIDFLINNLKNIDISLFNRENIKIYINRDDSLNIHIENINIHLIENNNQYKICSIKLNEYVLINEYENGLILIIENKLINLFEGDIQLNKFNNINKKRLIEGLSFIIKYLHYYEKECLLSNKIIKYLELEIPLSIMSIQI